MSRFEDTALSGSKRSRTSPLIFDPTPPKRASPTRAPPRKLAKSSPARFFGKVVLHIRPPVPSEEDLFSSWLLDESQGGEVPGLLLGDMGLGRFEAWFCDELLSEL